MRIIRLIALALLLASAPLMAADIEEGIAAYYSDVFQGRKTASGKRYDKNALTAAHNHLPFGTRVRVTNPRNGKSVEVTITDRGPHGGKRIIDLSRAAARRIGLIRQGIGRVRLEVLERPAR